MALRAGLAATARQGFYARIKGREGRALVKFELRQY
jgi:hypothetical protein